MCGASATLVQLIIVFALSYTIIPAMDGMMVNGQPITKGTRAFNLVINNLIAFPFSNLVAYLLNALWVFTPGRHSKLKEFAMFTGISLFSLLIGLSITLLIEWYNWPTGLAQIGIVITSAMVNYVCRKFLIFLE